MTTATAPGCHHFTVDQYHRMIDTGVLGEGEGVELIEGLIIRKGRWQDGEPVRYHFSADQCMRMVAAGIVSAGEAFALTELGGEPEMPRSPAHDSGIDRLDAAIRPLLPAGWRLRIQSAIRLPGGEPEPDVAVVLGPAGRYDRTHPGPAEIGMLVEVSDSTLAYDRTLKFRAYAAAGIPAYWLVNLVGRQVEVYTDPDAPPGAEPRYRTRTDYQPGQQASVLVAGTAVGSVSVDAILPPA